MDQDHELREQVVNLLIKSNAHMSLEDAVKEFPMDRINEVYTNGTYTAWALLEHIRFTQSDIVEFITADKYTEKAWPEDYWPKEGTQATAAQWDQTIKMFMDDISKLVEFTRDPKNDLYAKVPNGDGQTFLRELLLVADHNAYHIGEFAIMRQVMGTWGKSHKA